MDTIPRNPRILTQNLPPEDNPRYPEIMGAIDASYENAQLTNTVDNLQTQSIGRGTLDISRTGQFNPAPEISTIQPELGSISPIEETRKIGVYITALRQKQLDLAA